MEHPLPEAALEADPPVGLLDDIDVAEEEEPDNAFLS